MLIAIILVPLASLLWGITNFIDLKYKAQLEVALKFKDKKYCYAENVKQIRKEA